MPAIAAKWMQGDREWTLYHPCLPDMRWEFRYAEGKRRNAFDCSLPAHWLENVLERAIRRGYTGDLHIEDELADTPGDMK